MGTSSKVGILGDWKALSIGNLFDLLPTSTKSRADLGDDGEVAYVHYGDIHTKWNTKLDFDAAEIPKLAASSVVNAARLRDGDLILADTSEDTEGLAKGVEVCNLRGRAGVSGLHTFLLRPKDDRLADGFKGHLIGAQAFRCQVRRFAVGIKVFALTKRSLREIVVPIPPPAEQRAIAVALSDADALIAALDALIAKKRSMKQGAMQQLLTGRTRLPGFEKRRGFSSTSSETIPLDWRVAELRTCLEQPPSYGVNAPAVPHDESLPTYLRITDIDSGGRFAPSPRVSVRHRNAYDYRLGSGDLVFARTGASVGKSYLYNPDDGVLVFAGFLIRVRPKPRLLNPAFLAFYAQSKRYWEWVASVSARTGQPGINGQQYGDLEVPLPLIDEQDAIAAILSDMDVEIAKLERRRDKMRAIKQGMMQVLLTGRVRLATASEAVKA